MPLDPDNDMFVNLFEFQAFSKYRPFGGLLKKIKTENEIKQINSDYKTITIKFKKSCMVNIKAETDNIAV